MKSLTFYRQLVEVRAAIQELEEKLSDSQDALTFLKEQHKRLEEVSQDDEKIPQRGVGSPEESVERRDDLNRALS